MNPRTLRAWRRTEYRVGAAVARIGRRSAEIDAVLRAMGVRQGAFVSACNPLGRRMPDGVNARAMSRLSTAVRRSPTAAGEGVGRGWREAHLLVGTDRRRARVIGRRFRQAGIVVVRRDGAVAKLVVLSAAHGANHNVQPGSMDLQFQNNSISSLNVICHAIIL